MHTPDTPFLLLHIRALRAIRELLIVAEDALEGGS